MKIDIQDIAGKSVAAMERLLHPKTLWFLLLGVAFAASAIATFARPFSRPATLFFPAQDGKGLVAELRYILPSRSGALPEELLVEELILGPSRIDARPVSVPGADIRLVKRGANTLYVDLSAQILFGKQRRDGLHLPPPLEPVLALACVRRTVSWNFPAKQLMLTVEGAEPAFAAPAATTESVEGGSPASP